MSKPKDEKAVRSVLREPIDVVDGIPDRSPNAAWWKYVLLGAIFLGWVAFLVYVRIAGSL